LLFVCVGFKAVIPSLGLGREKILGDVFVALS